MNIFEASRTNSVSALETALADIDPNVTDGRGSTPLIIAAYYNNIDVTRVLLLAGADPEKLDSMGNTALMGACFKGNTDAVKMLLEGGAEADTRNGNQATALTFAATFGQADIIALLLQHGADPLIRDNIGKTPVDHAMVQENDKCYELLAAAANGQINRLSKTNVNK